VNQRPADANEEARRRSRSFSVPSTRLVAPFERFASDYPARETFGRVKQVR